MPRLSTNVYAPPNTSPKIIKLCHLPVLLANFSRKTSEVNLKSKSSFTMQKLFNLTETYTLYKKHKSMLSCDHRGNRLFISLMIKIGEVNPHSVNL